MFCAKDCACVAGMFAVEDVGWEKAAVTGGWVNGAEKFAWGPREPKNQQVSKLPIINFKYDVGTKAGARVYSIKTAGAFDQTTSARTGEATRTKNEMKSSVDVAAHEARERKKKKKQVITKQAYLEIAGENLAAS